MAGKVKSFDVLDDIFKNGEDVIEKTFIPEKDQKYTLVSTVAFLIGVREEFFGENKNFEIEQYNKLKLNKSARVMRNLCLFRNALEHFCTKILVELNNGREVLSMTEYIPQQAITELTNDGVKLTRKARTSPFEYFVEVNGLIADRINNCKSVLPDWVNWEYIKEIFIMPDGRTESGVKEAGTLYKEYYNCYPYHIYINWPVPHDDGNILLNDRKFVTLLYLQNYDDFIDLNKVIDVSKQIKGNIYDFIKSGKKIDMIVDCENSDVYNIISMLRNLDWEHLEKISKIILVNDVHTNLGWQELEKCTDIPIEHIMTQRVMEEKSLVDGTVIAKAFMEYYEEEVDSFVLLSSDSDFWTLVGSLKNKANFLVMVEHFKCSQDYKEILADAGVLCCYLDDFNSGEESEQMKTDILLRAINAELDKSQINLKSIFDEALHVLRISMNEAQTDQFYKKYLKTAQLAIDESGNVKLECGGRK